MYIASTSILYTLLRRVYIQATRQIIKTPLEERKFNGQSDCLCKILTPSTSERSIWFFDWLLGVLGTLGFHPESGSIRKYIPPAIPNKPVSDVASDYVNLILAWSKNQERFNSNFQKRSSKHILRKTYNKICNITHFIDFFMITILFLFQL